ncbi:MAG TPA: hypothetical protein VKX28_20695 [Xanthobacteraceae bacterium]|nr:hypothetical protein [Xanthobacteraceae bacterium]
MIVHVNSSTARTCAVMLLLVGSGLGPSIAVATEVDRGGTFINQQCGAERTGCHWCTINGCYTVTGCSATTCTIKRLPGPQTMDIGRGTRGTHPVLHSTNAHPSEPTHPSTHKH